MTCFAGHVTAGGVPTLPRLFLLLAAIGTIERTQAFSIATTTATTTVGRTRTTTTGSVLETKQGHCYDAVALCSVHISLCGNPMLNHTEAAPNNGLVPIEPPSLYGVITSRENLEAAAHKAFLGKAKNPRFYAAKELSCLYVDKLYKQIRAGTYMPHSEREFDLWCVSGQKVRHITVPSISDLIVQHAIYRVIEPIIDPKLISDSYGCRLGGGSHKAAAQCYKYVKQSPAHSFCLQLDVHKDYYNLDHALLKEALLHLLKEQRAVDFIALQFNAVDDVKGMPVGAMIAQIMGLVYLNGFDHYVKRVLKVPRYIRYVDDMVFLGLSKDECRYLRDLLTEYINKEYKLTFSKANIFPISRGVNFVGYRAWQDKRLIRKRSMKVFHDVVRKERVNSVRAVLVHSQKTCSYPKMVSWLKGRSPAMAGYLSL